MGHNLVVTVWQALSTNDGQVIVKMVVTVITSYKGGEYWPRCGGYTQPGDYVRV